MSVEKQNADGSYSGIREEDGQETWRAGGYSGPAGSNTPGFLGGSTLAFNVAGGTDTGGGILSWQNNLGYDIMVTAHQIDVTSTATTACGVSFGQAANGTTLANNMISGQDVHTTTGTFNGGALSVKVANGTWITGSKASGTSAGLVARAYFTYMPAAAAGGK